MYSPQLQKPLPPIGLQPAASFSSQSSFGDMPADLGPRPVLRSPEMQNATLHSHIQPLPMPDHAQRSQVVAPMIDDSPTQPQSSTSSNSGYIPGFQESGARKPTLAPINNEALLRRQFPIFQWGMSGKAVYVIPPAISFGGGASHSEIKIVPVSQVLKSDPLISKFPFSIVTSKGPQKSKKKELEKWIEDHIKEVEAKLKDLPPEASSRLVDRVILWKVMLNLLQSDSTLTKPSTSLIESIRKTLDPFIQAQSVDELESFAPAVDIYHKNKQRRSSGSGNISNRSLNTEDIACMVDFLKVGQRERALKYALDQHLWSHALIMASSLGPTHWLDAVFEFVREEIRTFPSQSARDLALMYRVFSGAGADSGMSFSIYLFYLPFIINLFLLIFVFFFFFEHC